MELSAKECENIEQTHSERDTGILTNSRYDVCNAKPILSQRITGYIQYQLSNATHPT